MRLGKIRVISGINISSTANIKARPMKGRTENIICSIVVSSGAAPLTTNKSKPNGGVAKFKMK